MVAVSSFNVSMSSTVIVVVCASRPQRVGGACKDPVVKGGGMVICLSPVCIYTHTMFRGGE